MSAPKGPGIFDTPKTPPPLCPRGPKSRPKSFTLRKNTPSSLAAHWTDLNPSPGSEAAKTCSGGGGRVHAPDTFRFLVSLLQTFSHFELHQPSNKDSTQQHMKMTRMSSRKHREAISPEYQENKKVHTRWK